MVSLLNEARLNAGQPVMGFFSPFLCKNAAAVKESVLGLGIAELAETRFAGGYPAFHNHIEPYLAVWTS
jgi:hypothetical protein